MKSTVPNVMQFLRTRQQSVMKVSTLTVKIAVVETPYTLKFELAPGACATELMRCCDFLRSWRVEILGTPSTGVYERSPALSLLK